jgi:hypothetical protein
MIDHPALGNQLEKLAKAGPVVGRRASADYSRSPGDQIEGVVEARGRGVPAGPPPRRDGHLLGRWI